VAGRLISDNIIIAQEMFHGLRTNKACQKQSIWQLKWIWAKRMIEWNETFLGLITEIGF